jgi:O-antigen/teichoic acid export membrane protein
MMNILQKYKNLSLPLKATIWFTICNFILKGISFITVPLFARYLSPEQYGITSVYNSYQQIFLIFATLELSLGAFQRGIIRYKENLNLFINSLQLLWSSITVILFMIVLLFKDLFIKLTDTNLVILTLMFGYFLVYPAYDCWANQKRFNYDYRPVVIATILFAIVTTCGSLFSVIFIKQTAIVRITSILIIQILYCAPFYFKNINIKKLIHNLSKVKEFWLFSLNFQLPLIFHSLSYLVLAQSDRIMIGMMVGKSEAALYSVAYSLSNVVIIFQTSINQVLKPWRYQKMESKEYKLICSITNLLLVIIGMVLLLFVLIAPEIMKLLFNVDYYEAIWTIPPVTLSVYFMFLYSVFTDIESYFCKTKYIMYASIICAIINVVLNYFGIIYFGYISCGYATLFSYILFAIMHYLYMVKSCKQEGIKKSIFNKKVIIVLSSVYIFLMIVCVMIYPYTSIRIIIFLLILLLFFIKRNVIISTIKLLKNKI